MDQLEPHLDRLRDPLSEPTRSARKALLAVSTTGIVIVKAGLVPTEVAALGIQLRPDDQQTILTVLGLITAYFLISFLIYAASDLAAWQVVSRRTAAEGLKDRLTEVAGSDDTDTLSPDMTRALSDYFGDLALWFRRAAGFSYARAAFDFGIPLIIAAYALTLVW